MDKMISQFLNLLAVSMGTIEKIQVPQNVNWSELYQLADMHHVAPMIYDALPKEQLISTLPNELSDQWRDNMISNSLKQVYCNMQFLHVYRQLKQAGMKAIVVKGLVLRDIYPDNYYRISGDEDILIDKADFETIDSILLANGLVRDNCCDMANALKQEIKYQGAYGLTIEIHTNLFNPYLELFGEWNKLFENSIKDSIIMEIELIPIDTLSHYKHFLFLVLHSIKHFMVNGFGIRQLCDIVMYCNKFGKEIDWERLWQQFADLNYLVFFGSLIEIGIKYLGLNQSMIYVPAKYDALISHSEALLMDIMEAGIYGKRNQDQIKSGSITLQAVIEDKKQGARSGHFYIMKALLPSRQYMSAHYSYCKKSPMLLPIAWIHRFIINMIEIGKHGKIIKKTKNSIQIGRKRIRLLREYHLIGVSGDSIPK